MAGGVRLRGHVDDRRDARLCGGCDGKQIRKPGGFSGGYEWLGIDSAGDLAGLDSRVHRWQRHDNEFYRTRIAASLVDRGLGRELKVATESVDGNRLAVEICRGLDRWLHKQTCYVLRRIGRGIAGRCDEYDRHIL